LATSAEINGQGDSSLAAALAEETPPTIIGFSPLQREIVYGETITLTIRITDVVDLYAAQVNAHFDPAILMVVDASQDPGVQITPGSFPPAAGFYTSKADNQAGTVYYAASLLGAVPPASGSGTLATITFRGIGGGIAQVSITSVIMSRPDFTAIQPVIGEDAVITVTRTLYPAHLPLTLRNFAP
jgi:hypothetical protein